MSTTILLPLSKPEKKKNTVTPRKLHHLFLYNRYLVLLKEQETLIQEINVIFNVKNN
jgi:hypothetical protein